jgi:shikimate kinase
VIDPVACVIVGSTESRPAIKDGPASIRTTCRWGETPSSPLISLLDMIPKPRSIILIGMMGAGKSSVGRTLERRTNLPRFDLDEMIQAKAEMSIPEIFAAKGEECFRDLESTVLKQLTREAPGIVVTGGGIILRPENTEILKRLGTVVWLEADEAILLERSSRRRNRPLLQTGNPAETIVTLLAQRRPLYAAAADLRVDTTTRTHDEVTDIILQELEGHDR